jgi:hypothetical protein
LNVTRSLHFAWTPWSAATALLVVLGTVALSFVAWRRSGYRRSVGLLELLRIGVVAGSALLLNQPEWVEEYRPDEKPAIGVFWDDSPSMGIRDVVHPAAKSAGAGAGPLTRREAIAALTRKTTWDALRNRMNVVIQPFSPPRPGHGTDLYEPLSSAPRRIKNLRGIVVASDGDWNEGKPPVQAAARLRMQGVPVFAVPVGSKIRLPDVELLNVDVPTFGVAGKSVRIPFTIARALPREYVTTVSLRSSDGDEVTKEVHVAPMTRTSDWLIWKPKAVGDTTLTLAVPPHAEEVLVENNKASMPIAIREEKLRVLVIESYPRWEYRYLRNALSRDPGVEVSCLLFHPGLSKVGGGNKDYIPEFPRGLDALSKYDVVFLGDVGLDDDQLSTEDCRLLRGLVEHQASGLVFLPGLQGRELSLLDTPLGDLLPVVLDPAQPGGWGSRTPNHFELTETGRRSLLTKLADTQDDNVAVWEGLPGFQWYAAVLRAKAGCETLCVHKDASNEFGRLPLLVTRTFGAGKVLFMGTDGAWRWRKGVEDKYHYRFWGQVVRWMAYQRNMAKGETMRLYYSPDQPRMNQTVALHANVMDRSGEPLHGGDVGARIVPPSGKAEVVRLASEGDEWGVFAGRFHATEAGRHRIILTCKQTGATLETNVFVQGVAAEPLGRPARPEVLEELARVTQGQVLPADRIDEVVRYLDELPEPPPSVRRVPLWSHPVVAGGLIALMGVFWVGRKVVGLL